MGIRKYSYLLSVCFIGSGLALMVQQKGLNWGVDFTGGRSYIVSFNAPLEASNLKTKLAKSFGNQGLEIKTYGSNNILKITTSYLIEDESEQGDKKVKNTLIEGLKLATGKKNIQADTTHTADTFFIASASKVGAAIAGDIKDSAKKAIILSLIIIFLYILIRFQRFQFGFASLVALFHDTLCIFAAFAMARAAGYAFEVDQIFVAAILTVIGYSINDTVVVFDRIREKIRETQGTFLQVANRSINDTLSRTLITSFTTFIAVFILFLFGGEVLRGFSFALLIGIVFGTYSSIFIATPLIVDLSKKEDKQRGDK